MPAELLAALRQLGLLADLSDEDVERLTSLEVEGLADEELGRLDAVLRSALDSVVESVESDEAENGDEALAAAAGLRDGILALAAAAHGRMTAVEQRQSRIDAIVASIGGGPEQTSEGAPSHRPPLERVSARRRRQEPPRRSSHPGGVEILAGRGGELANMGAIAAELIEMAELNRYQPIGEGTATASLVASIRAVDVPEERQLVKDDVVGNSRKVAALAAAARSATPQALAASGGLCAPIVPRYAVSPILPEAHRPLRDSLPSFQADRGGIIYRRPPLLTDVDDSDPGRTAGVAIGVWTEANDVALNNPATKPILRLGCLQNEQELVEAITLRTELGNFYNSTDPESVAAFMETATAAHARLAENQLIDKIRTGSTAVVGGQVIGATRDILAHLDRAVAEYRVRNRMPRTATLAAAYPEWVLNLMRADVTRQLPGDDELDTTDEEIVGWFRTRGVAPTFYADNVPTVFSHQTAGALDGWPDSLEWGLWAPGTWLFLDNGRIDLGIIRDSVLANTNDLQTFMETFEGAARVGVESLWITSYVCPSGETAATADTSAVCNTGS